jgi:hypothetical protein
MNDNARGLPALVRRPTLLAPDQVPRRAGVVAAFTSTERREDWTLPQHLRVVATAGNVELDLRTARLSTGRSVIEVVAFLGNVEIVVPPGIRVEHHGEGVLGMFEYDPRGHTSPGGDAPVIEVRGRALLGNVEVRTVDPSEPDSTEDEDDWLE